VKANVPLDHLSHQSNQRPMGMNAPNNDDRQLALNIVHWLSRLLP
jgi:hypothetical protein